MSIGHYRVKVFLGRIGLHFCANHDLDTLHLLSIPIRVKKFHAETGSFSSSDLNFADRRRAFACSKISSRKIFLAKVKLIADASSHNPLERTRLNTHAALSL